MLHSATVSRNLRTRIAAAGLGLLLAAAGCGKEKNLYRADRSAPILTFEIKDAGKQVVWKLWNRDGKTVSKISYRLIPPGFIEEAPPARQRPRDFRPGEPLTVFVAFRDGWCRYSVTATGPDSYHDDYHQCAQVTQR